MAQVHLSGHRPLQRARLWRRGLTSWRLIFLPSEFPILLIIKHICESKSTCASVYVCLCSSVFGCLSKMTFKQLSSNLSSPNWYVPFSLIEKRPLPLCNQIHTPILKEKKKKQISLAILSNRGHIRKGDAHIRCCPGPILLIIPSVYHLHGPVT